MNLDEFRKRFDIGKSGIYCNSVFERNESLRFLERCGYALGKNQKRYITTNDPEDNAQFLHPVFNLTVRHITCCRVARPGSFIVFDDIRDLIYGEDENDDQCDDAEMQEALFEVLSKV